ncbi:MAG TPA: M24 family metallopeptidase [Clostridia bacterium]|nr:M24 family metallopeptidase [Clostridia bacterium]
MIRNGFKDNLLHWTGHGIGLGNHEGPFIAEGSTDILKESMVISIEPGIYIQNLGGFRHSDTVLVTKDGFELLTDAPPALCRRPFLQPVRVFSINDKKEQVVNGFFVRLEW